jgi:branched-chain amino acid transport system ATP-binding protein
MTPNAASSLCVRGLVKRFGGLVATDHLDLDVQPGEIHAVIGPNGAGKTTLISQLSGELMPDGGSIWLDGLEVVRESVQSRVHRGIARSYQFTSVFQEFTALQNAMLAVQGASGGTFSFWKPISRARWRVPSSGAWSSASLPTRTSGPWCSP